MNNTLINIIINGLKKTVQLPGPSWIPAYSITPSAK